MAPSTSGDLVTGAADQGTPSNLSGALLASRLQMSVWSSARMLTPNDPLRSMTGQVFEVVMTQKPTSGGSSDTEKKEPAAMPTGRPSSSVATMLTPVGKDPRIWRNRAASSTTTTSSLIFAPWRLGGPSVGEVEEQCVERCPVPPL